MSGKGRRGDVFFRAGSERGERRTEPDLCNGRGSGLTSTRRLASGNSEAPRGHSAGRQNAPLHGLRTTITPEILLNGWLSRRNAVESPGSRAESPIFGGSYRCRGIEKYVHRLVWLWTLDFQLSTAWLRLSETAAARIRAGCGATSATRGRCRVTRNKYA